MKFTREILSQLLRTEVDNIICLFNTLRWEVASQVSGTKAYNK